MFVNILCYCSTEKAAHCISINFKYSLKIILYSTVNPNSNVTIFVALINHIRHSLFLTIIPYFTCDNNDIIFLLFLLTQRYNNGII